MTMTKNTKKKSVSSRSTSPLTAAASSPALEHALRALEAALPVRASAVTSDRRRELGMLRRVTADAIRDAADLARAHGFTEFDVDAATAAIEIERASLPLADRLRLLADALEVNVSEHRERPARQTLALRETLLGLARMSGNQLLLPAIDRMKGKITGGRRRRTTPQATASAAAPAVTQAAGSETPHKPLSRSPTIRIAPTAREGGTGPPRAGRSHFVVAQLLLAAPTRGQASVR